MKSVRTPDDRFANLADWPYAPVYTTVSAGDGTTDTLRVAHYEAGPAGAGETILVMHGEPSWSYLYRKMMAAFVAAGHRVIAPTSWASAAATSRCRPPTTPTNVMWRG